MGTSQAKPSAAQTPKGRDRGCTRAQTKETTQETYLKTKMKASLLTKTRFSGARLAIKAASRRSASALDEVIEEIKDLDLSGKKVAVFGCGDSSSYGDYFCDAIEEVYSAMKDAGATMVGFVDPSGYDFAESKSVIDGKFCGLPLDEDNESDMTEDRVAAW